MSAYGKYLVAAVAAAWSMLANPASAEINGYFSSPSVVQDSTVGLHISTDAATYSMKIYRFGSTYKLMQARTSLRGAQYAVPEQAWMIGAQWPRALTLRIPEDWPSGIYRVQLLTEPEDPVCADVGDVGRDTVHPHCVTLTLIVTPSGPGSRAKILVLDNTPTLAAYNDWGGASLYTPGAHAVSLLRPSNNETAFWWDLEFAAWAARMRIPLEYASMMDLHSDKNLLEKYDVVVIVGHSEYWSSEMRKNVEDFSKSGGHLVILSGNTMWWQIRIEGDKIICYKNAEADPLLNLSRDRVTVNWFDWPINAPENSAIGVSWRYGGYVNAFDFYMAGPDNNNGAYRVSNARSWVYEGTGLRNGDYFGKDRTIVGYEVDGALFAFQGGKPVVTGEDGTPLNFEILAYAPAANVTFPTDGYATMGVFHRPGHGGWVFNAATTDWADGLWDLFDKVIPDAVVSRVTLNVLQRFANIND